MGNLMSLDELLIHVPRGRWTVKRTRPPGRADAELAALLLLIKIGENRGLIRNGDVDVEACEKVLIDGSKRGIHPKLWF
jgi:hypothetical protein